MGTLSWPVIATFVLAIATFVMAFGTFIMAVETKRHRQLFEKYLQRVHDGIHAPLFPSHPRTLWEFLKDILLWWR